MLFRAGDVVVVRTPGALAGSRGGPGRASARRNNSGLSFARILASPSPLGVHAEEAGAEGGGGGVE
jgi:hypothetical protein